MKTLLVTIVASVCLLSAVSSSRADQVSDLQDITVGSGGTYTAPSFTSGNAQYDGLTNPYSDGFTVSNHTDTTDYGDNAYQYLYDAIPGHGAGSSSQYAVASAFTSASVRVPTDPVSVDVTNTTYAYYSMSHGDSFAKQFGGDFGSDPDWFLLTITGYNASNSPVGTVPFYLADYRFTDHAQDYIVSQWTAADLSSLVGARTLTFSLSSSDVGAFGMNTPGFFALDNLHFASASMLGDMNGDGARNNFDISPFELALADPSAFLATYPAVTDYAQRGDINSDSAFDNFDIGPFESLLAGSTASQLGSAVPEPSGLALAAIGLVVFAGRFFWRRTRVPLW